MLHRAIFFFVLIDLKKCSFQTTMKKKKLRRMLIAQLRNKRED